MEAKKRKYGFLSKGKHIIANKKHEWDTDRKEMKELRAKAEEAGKRKAKDARRRQYEREAEEKYKRRYGVSSESPGPSNSRQPFIPAGEPYDPFGMDAAPRPKKKGGSPPSKGYDFGFSDNWK